MQSKKTSFVPRCDLNLRLTIRDDDAEAC